MKQTIDTQALKTRDIAAVIQRDLGPAVRQRNGHLYWRCPFHDDHDPSLDVNSTTNRAYCNPCGLSLDAAGWLMKYHKVSFPDAARQLGALTDLPAVAVVEQPKSKQAYKPPARDWESRAAHAVRHCVHRLWHDDPQAARVRAWLNRRGLNDATLRRWRVGYNPAARHLFGLFVQPGIIIPAYMDRELWSVKIRLLPEHPFACQACGAQMTAPGVCGQCGKRNKYRSVKGGRPALFGAATCRNRRVAFGCEGEFDAMLVWQQCRDLGGVFTSTNGALKDWQPEWSLYLLDCEQVILLHDNDEAGRQGKVKLSALGARVFVTNVPRGKDVTDYHVAGGNLFAWLNLERRAALAAGYESDEAEAAYLRDRLESGNLPHDLYADYAADLAELEEDQ